MSEDKFQIPEKYKKWLDLKMWALIGIIAKIAWDTFTVGAEVKYQQHFQENLQKEGAKNIIRNQINTKIDSSMNDANMWKKAFGTDYLINEIVIAKEEVKKEIYLSDSSKIDFVGAIGVNSGVRDEEVIAIIAKLVEAIDHGDLLFKDDVEDYIDKEVKRRTTRVVRAEIP